MFISYVSPLSNCKDLLGDIYLTRYFEPQIRLSKDLVYQRRFTKYSNKEFFFLGSTTFLNTGMILSIEIKAQYSRNTLGFQEFEDKIIIYPV
jgi:hypothetical protein